jgi:biopolymer transport protein ExbD
MSTAATSGESAKPRDVRLVVTDSGQYILSGKPVALADLRARLRDLKSSGAPINLHVIGGPKVTYELVMPAMQIVQEEGLGKEGLLTIPPTAPDSSASASSK